MNLRTFGVRLLVVAALLLGMMPAQALFAQDDGMAMPGEVVAEGLNGPMGILIDPNGDIWVVDSGLGGGEEVDGMDFSGQPVTIQYGPTARIVKISAADGVTVDVAALTSVSNGTENEGGSRLALLDGVLYATGAGWHPAVVPATAEGPLPGTGSLWMVGADGTVSEAAPIWQLERDNNPVSAELDNHPYGLLAGPDGNLWVADAGMNALLKVDPATGASEIVATFDPIPGVFPNPNYDGEMLTDAVPTGVAVADGGVYVSFLSGGPFIPGSAKVVSVAEDGAVSDFATGLTMLTDLRTGPDGALYATQFGMFTEQGPVPGSGAVLRIKEGDASEIVVPGLMFPTSIDFNTDGDAFVTVNGVGAPGSGQVVKFAGLTAMEGMPVAEAMAAMAPPADAAAAEAAPTEEAMAEAAPTEEAMAEAAPTEEAMAEAAPTEEAMAEAAPAEQAPEKMPVTGADGGQAGIVVVLLLVAALAGVVFFGRRQTA
ncbi:MAG: ScyD/ScyE family protein [Caldilinea sp.]|nr:ScyD/ScyE family protein [Caldilinea sp.]